VDTYSIIFIITIIPVGLLLTWATSRLLGRELFSTLLTTPFIRRFVYLALLIATAVIAGLLAGIIGDSLSSVAVAPSRVAPTYTPNVRSPTQVASTSELSYAPDYTEKVRVFLQELAANPEDGIPIYLPKYIDDLVVMSTEKKVGLFVLRNIETREEFLRLSEELIYAVIIISHTAESGDWGLDRIEVVNYGPYNSFVMSFIEGHSNLEKVALGEAEFFDLLEEEINLGDVPTGCASVSSLNVRMGPGKGYGAKKSIPFGTCVALIGRNDTASWVKQEDGWMYASMMDIHGDVYSLPIVEHSP